MEFYQTVLELIDMRSFTSMWYWIVMAIFWSMMSHFVLGVPFDLVQRTLNTQDDESWRDLEDLARINAKRLYVIGRGAGIIIAALAAFILTAVFLLGFLYEVEFCQALFLLLLPFTLIGMIAQNTARRVLQDTPRRFDLVRCLRRQRLATQVIGMISIFVSAFWGVFHAMETGVL